MTVAQTKIQLAQKLLQTEDKHILKAVESILNPVEEHIELSSEQKKDLDKRLADHKAGKLKYFTIDEVRSAVNKAIKK
jgi:putative addiction module component (TIGR02574 family)